MSRSSRPKQSFRVLSCSLPPNMQKYDIAGYDAIKIKIFKYRPENRSGASGTEPTVVPHRTAVLDEPRLRRVKARPLRKQAQTPPSKSPPAEQSEPREYRQSSARKNRRRTPSAIKTGTAAAPPLPTVRISGRTSDAENRFGSILPLHYRR